MQISWQAWLLWLHCRVLVWVVIACISVCKYSVTLRLMLYSACCMCLMHVFICSSIVHIARHTCLLLCFCTYLYGSCGPSKKLYLVSVWGIRVVGTFINFYSSCYRHLLSNASTIYSKVVISGTSDLEGLSDTAACHMWKCYT